MYVPLDTVVCEYANSLPWFVATFAVINTNEPFGAVPTICAPFTYSKTFTKLTGLINSGVSFICPPSISTP